MMDWNNLGDDIGKGGFGFIAGAVAMVFGVKRTIDKQDNEILLQKNAIAVQNKKIEECLTLERHNTECLLKLDPLKIDMQELKDSQKEMLKLAQETHGAVNTMLLNSHKRLGD